MSGENNGPDDKSKDGGQGGGDGKQGGDQSQQNQGFKPITYNSQEELDAAFADRATRAAESAKQEALKVFTDAGVSAEDALAAYNAQKEAEEAKKGPEAKERERAERDRAELKAYKDKEARDKLSVEVAKNLKVKIGQTETPIPASLLAGSTKEELEASGKAIIEFIGQLAGQQGPRQPQHNPLQGTNGEDKLQAGDPLRNYFATGSFT